MQHDSSLLLQDFALKNPDGAILYRSSRNLHSICLYRVLEESHSLLKDLNMLDVGFYLIMDVHHAFDDQREEFCNRRLNH